jgi:hypothetical protein
MMNIAKYSLLAVALAAAPIAASTQAVAGDYYRRHHNDALAAGALGYALNVLFLVVERRIVHWSGR